MALWDLAWRIYYHLKTFGSSIVKMVLQIEYVIVEFTISSLIVEQQNHDFANHSLPCLRAHYSTIAGKNQRNKACRRKVNAEKSCRNTCCTWLAFGRLEQNKSWIKLNRHSLFYYYHLCRSRQLYFSFRVSNCAVLVLMKQGDCWWRFKWWILHQML